MIYIFGHGGHAREVYWILIDNGVSESISFVSESKSGSLCNNPIIPESELPYHVKGVVAIGSPVIRKKVVDRINAAKSVEWISVISKRANLINNPQILGGCMIFPGSFVSCDTRIGNHVIVNANANVSHDCVLGDYATISPNASLSGNTTVLEGGFVGAGSAFVEGHVVGMWSVVGAGAVVTRDVPQFTTVVGIPARPIGLG